MFSSLLLSTYLLFSFPGKSRGLALLTVFLSHVFVPCLPSRGSEVKLLRPIPLRTQSVVILELFKLLIPKVLLPWGSGLSPSRSFSISYCNPVNPSHLQKMLLYLTFNLRFSFEDSTFFFVF